MDVVVFQDNVKPKCPILNLKLKLILEINQQ